ncbi:MAG: ABC transporter ATP-binding protein [Sphaerochaetaceae bacterium]
MNENVLECRQVTKKYRSGEGSLTVLENLDLMIKKGTSTAITGKSGSGKTTLLNVAGTLDRPSSGEVVFLSQPLHKASDAQLSAFRNKHIGFIFQAHILLEDFSALQNVALVARIGGMAAKEARFKAEELLNKVGLAQRLNHKPQRLSGGERQRVALCRALINDPDLLIADEPTGSLDEESAAEVEQLLFDLVLEEKRTLLLVTHEKELARRCDVVYLLQNRTLEVLK